MLCQILTVVGIDEDMIVRALQNIDFTDFEDCLQMECAREFIAQRNESYGRKPEKIVRKVGLAMGFISGNPDGEE